MKKYTAFVYAPANYEISAETQDEAKRKAVEQYKKDNNTRVHLHDR